MNSPDPIRLESISLSNIRRFGEDVTIRLGSGATILLAPNGSGKTAVFEAIELALTSAVQRVDGRIPHLIRDGLQHASVRLDFGSWQREVAVLKDKISVVKAGQFAELFGDVSPGQVPFLLRLTHLLDQRDRSWFCQQSPDEAGGQLDMLPIGRQASHVSAALAKLKPSATRKITDITELKVNEEAKVRFWNVLTAARDDAARELSGPIVPLTELATRLKAVFDDETVPLETTSGLREQCVAKKVAAGQRIDDSVTRLNSLAGLVALPSAHADGLAVLKIVSDELKGLQASRESHEAEMKKREDEIALAEPERKLVVQALAEARGTLQNVLTHQRLTGSLVQLNEEWNSIKRKIDSHNAVFDAASSSYQNAVTNNEVYDALRALASGFAQRTHEIALASGERDKWSNLISERSQYDKQLSDVAKALVLLTSEVASAQATRESLDDAHAHAQGEMESLRAATGAIRSAVSIIAESLPLDVGTCPVCEVNHGAEELRKRIADAMGAADPHLNRATQVYQLAKSKLEFAKEAESKKRAEFGQQEQIRDGLIKTIADLDNQIAGARSHHLLVGLEFEDTATKLSDLSKALAKEVASVEERKASLPSAVDAEALSTLAKSYAEARNEKERLTELDTRRQEAISEAKREILQIVFGSEAVPSVESLNRSIEVIGKQVDDFVGKINFASTRKLELSTLLEKIDSQISRVNGQLALNKSESATRLAQWTSAGLQNEPAAEALRGATEIAEQRLAEAQLAKSLLGDIELEIGRHAEANALERAQQDVDKERGRHTEEEYSQILQQSVDAVQERLNQAVNRKNTLDSFATNLANGIELIQDRVQAVVPQWHSILKRIVQEPRFSQTSLNYNRKRSKNKAGVAVSVGGMQAPVADIASQAQMTDLQLSFLLSMATVHQWSPWKALLLDDPTQHHDLVHASSVFDVLRDFISEQGYQLVLTTHDALQARFLMRKLSNDGIDARLWTLRPSEGGMIAQQIGGLMGYS